MQVNVTYCWFLKIYLHYTIQKCVVCKIDWLIDWLILNKTLKLTKAVFI